MLDQNRWPVSLLGLRLGVFVVMLMWAAAAALLCAAPASRAEPAMSGRDPVEAFLKPGAKASIPLEEILRGGPRVDGIPALADPVKVSTREADGFLAPDEVVLGVFVGGESAAYPLRLLNWHEVVNDVVGGRPVAVTYCPLCRTGLAFDRRVDGETLEFGVSGLLYKSNLLLYDRKTRSLWSQFKGEALVGPSTGKSLKRVPVAYAAWRDWKAAHPGTKAASFATLRPREYGSDPYAGYDTSREIYFPAGPADERLHPKELVLGFEVDGRAFAVPLKTLKGKKRLEIRAADRRITVGYEEGPRARLDDGVPLPGTVAYWFAWAAFHPGSRLVGK